VVSSGELERAIITTKMMTRMKMTIVKTRMTTIRKKMKSKIRKCLREAGPRRSSSTQNLT
jgi:hypothetical protein